MIYVQEITYPSTNILTGIIHVQSWAIGHKNARAQPNTKYEYKYNWIRNKLQVNPSKWENSKWGEDTRLKSSEKLQNLGVSKHMQATDIYNKIYNIFKERRNYKSGERQEQEREYKREKREREREYMKRKKRKEGAVCPPLISHWYCIIVVIFSMSML